MPIYTLNTFNFITSSKWLNIYRSESCLFNFISHLSQTLAEIYCVILYFGGAAGSVSYRDGTAKFKKAFFILEISTFFIIFTSSMVYNPATAAVVVAKAGTIFPALIFTFNQSVGFN